MNNQLVPYKYNPVLGPRNSAAELLGRVLKGRVDLRKGGRLPEEVDREQAAKLMALLKRRLVKKVDPQTGDVSFELSDAGAVSAVSGLPLMPTLCRQAHTLLGDALRALGGIHPLDPTGDPELVDARKAILESGLRALMQETCQPRPSFFHIQKLLEQAKDNARDLSIEVRGTASPTESVNTPDEDAVVANVRLFLSYIAGLDASFDQFSAKYFSLACLQQEIVFGLQTVADTVAQVRSQLLEEGVTEADLRVIRVKLPRTPGEIEDPVTADGFLSLNETEAARLSAIVERAGKIGVLAIAPHVTAIQTELREILTPPENFLSMRFLTRSEAAELIREFSRKAPSAAGEEGAKPGLPSYLSELIRRSPRASIFLFKLLGEWMEVQRLIEMVRHLDPTVEVVTLDKSSQK
jgi:hypothetical protein